MSRGQIRVWSMIGVTAAAALLLAAFTGLSFRRQELGAVGLLLGGMGACTAYFHLRRNRRFTMVSGAILQVTSYTLAFVVAMYGACALAQPLIDARLAAWDAAFGVHLPAIVAWTRAHPNLDRGLSFCYGTVLLQTVCKPWAAWRVWTAVANRPWHARRPRFVEVAGEQEPAATQLLLRE